MVRERLYWAVAALPDAHVGSRDHQSASAIQIMHTHCKCCLEFMPSMNSHSFGWPTPRSTKIKKQNSSYTSVWFSTYKHDDHKSREFPQLKILALITSARPTLPYKLAFSQVPGVRMGLPLRDHYSTYHRGLSMEDTELSLQSSPLFSQCLHIWVWSSICHLTSLRVSFHVSQRGMPTLYVTRLSGE